MSEADIADAIEKAFRSDEDTMLRWRKNVIDRASRFSWKAIAEKIEAILETL
jgi:glycosyltransferase involved in cell wall biosynthesis